MDNFKSEILNLENEVDNQDILVKEGMYPILVTSVHSMVQVKDDGNIKLNEPYTKAIAKYLSKNEKIGYFIKNKDTGEDSNHTDDDEFKKLLIDYINKNDIKLVIDLHGASESRPFDIELGTLNNLSADFSTIMELKEAFQENGISNIDINDPFKGGKVTQSVFFNTNAEVIQIEINKKYRDIENIENIEKVCTSISNFIKQYISIINRDNQ